MEDSPEQEELLDKPKIYVSHWGEIYVKVEDVLRSKKIRKRIDQMAKIPVTRNNRNRR